ncbi:uncharacterized protein LOC117315483 isoform X2 [Pecten maximus]|uniref:uncharacterized protein LOC117315483 isoform X2 n=1 Tax=Pecten maximus TaxID=6579 RepID=UPI00145843A8|nr:uncharacterized protein LOC117315483 isoform X2 [Pecten maximus]
MCNIMDVKYCTVLIGIVLTIITDCVLSQSVNNTGCVSNSWHKRWKSCYMKHCGSNPGTCVTSLGTPVCKRVKDSCGMCVKRWFVDKQVIECERTARSRECPPNVLLRNCPRSLCDAGCPDAQFNVSTCRVNRCGECLAEYFVEGLWMMCPSQLFFPNAGNNELTGLTFFHPEVVGGSVMTGEAATSSVAAAGRQRLALPSIARSVSSSDSFRSAGPGDIPEPIVCPRGLTQRTCPNMCQNLRCTNYPEAVCRVNHCGRCRTEFYVGELRVNCRGQKCKPGVQYFHTCNSCAYNYCHNHPTAECRMDACGKCKSSFWLNNNKVSCTEQNIIDTCPDRTKQRYVCDSRVCVFDTCPQNSTVACVVDNCGGCKPQFIHKLTREVVKCPGYWDGYQNKFKGRVATAEEINRARAERDRELRQSQTRNTGSRTSGPLGQISGFADSPSIPQMPSRIPTTGGRQADPIGTFDLSDLGSLPQDQRATLGRSNNQQISNMFNELSNQIESSSGSSSSSPELSPMPPRRRTSRPEPPTSSVQGQVEPPSSIFSGMNRRGNSNRSPMPSRRPSSFGRPSDSGRSNSNDAPSSIFAGMNRRRPSGPSRRQPPNGGPAESGRSNSNDAPSSLFEGLNRRRPSSGSPRPPRRQSPSRLPPINNSPPASNDSPSDVFSGMNRRGSSSGSPMPQRRQSERIAPPLNSPAQNAQRMAPVVRNVPSESLIVRTEQVPVINQGLSNSLPVVQAHENNLAVPNAPGQPSVGNAQAEAVIDNIIQNLDTAIRNAHPPMERTSSTAGRPVDPKMQSALNSPLSADAMREKPSISSAKQGPLKPLVEKRVLQTPLSSHTIDKSSLQNTKSGRRKEATVIKPRESPVVNTKGKNTKKAVSEQKPTERKTVTFQSLMFPTEFFSLFQTLGGGSAVAIPSQLTDTTTRKS